MTWLAVATIFRYSSLAALCAAAIAPIMSLIAGYQWWETLFAFVLAALIFWRHSANIARLRAGTEPKIGAKKDDPVTAEAASPAPPAEPSAE